MCDAVITSPMGDGGVDSQQENSGYGSGTGTVPTGASTLPTVEMLTSVSPQVDPSSQSHAAVVTGTAAATISSTPFVNVSDSPRVHSLTTGAIVGIVFGVVFALAMLLALLVFVLRRNGNSGRYIGYRVSVRIGRLYFRTSKHFKSMCKVYMTQNSGCRRALTEEAGVNFACKFSA